MTRPLPLPIALLWLILCAAPGRADDWPQFRGPARDGASNETGLLQSWPDGGPKKLWEAEDAGFGWSSVAVVGDMLYTTGLYGKDLHVVALSTADGKRLWHTRLDKAAPGGGFRGARTTPTVDGDRLFVLSGNGRLACLARDDGEIAWSKNVLKAYGAPNARHSLGESPLVDGDRVIVTAGGRASVVAFDKATGEEVWAAPPAYKRVAYASARIVEHDGLRQVVGMTGKDLFGVHAGTGKLLWTHPRPTPHEININAPHFAGGLLLVTSGYKVGTEALELLVDGQSARVKRKWNAPALDDYQGGLVVVGDLLIGTCHEQKPGLVALRVKTGEVAYKNTDVHEATIIAADGRLVVQQYDGHILLVDPTDGRIVSRFRVPCKKSARSKFWGHPAIADGRLYLRRDDAVLAFDIRRSK